MLSAKDVVWQQVDTLEKKKAARFASSRFNRPIYQAAKKRVLPNI
jgi:hypothetical protein